MSDSFEQQVDEASRRFSQSCFQPRYRVAWLVGQPQSGKSILARRLCQRHQWAYLDYTLHTGYFDQRAADILSYQPDNFIVDLRSWCVATHAAVLVVDEIDALLAFWSVRQRRIWLAETARLANLPCGLLLVTHFFDPAELQPYLPDNDIAWYFNLSGGSL